MSTGRSEETCVINAPVEKVWQVIRSMDLKWTGTVQESKIEEGSENSVPSTRLIKYTDGTEQRYMVTGLSDLARSTSFELVTSEPAVGHSSASHSITVKRVTQNNTSFVSWVTEFSTDAGQEVVQDSKFKKLDAFAALAKACA
eukprot:TRINITY_DN24132_c0_g1_i1.p1 TRINITY_DN24132_c0_g1~~TRINITY_DN24132_c0_g1_i1.p1  ORF type:complete len:143 (+),score=22.89 TRINITY_DN24132_c0_g1_i1:41-469(+)